jgi:hypothetical protein
MREGAFKGGRARGRRRGVRARRGKREVRPGVLLGKGQFVT